MNTVQTQIVRVTIISIIRTNSAYFKSKVILNLLGGGGGGGGGGEPAAEKSDGGGGAEAGLTRPVSVANQTQCCGKLNGKSGVCSLL